MRRITTLIENYIRLERERKEKIQRHIDAFLDDTELKKTIARRLLPKNSKSKIGVTANLEKAYEDLVSEFSEAKVYVRYAELDDMEHLISGNNNVMTVYTEMEHCHNDESNYRYIEFKFFGLMMLAHVSKIAWLCINEGENSLRLSNKLCGEILSGSKEYRFIARDKTLLKYDLECIK